MKHLEYFFASSKINQAPDNDFVQKTQNSSLLAYNKSFKTYNINRFIKKLAFSTFATTGLALLIFITTPAGLQIKTAYLSYQLDTIDKELSTLDQEISNNQYFEKLFEEMEMEIDFETKY